MAERSRDLRIGSTRGIRAGHPIGQSGFALNMDQIADRIVREVVMELGDMLPPVEGSGRRGPRGTETRTRTREAVIPHRFRGEPVERRGQISSAEQRMMSNYAALADALFAPAAWIEIQERLRRSLEPMPPLDARYLDY